MMPTRMPFLIRGIAIGCAIASLTSCSVAKDPGLELAVSVAPSKVNIVPGKGVSCVAAYTAKSTGETPIPDLTGERVLFNKFAMQWKSDDKLTIASITAKIFSDGIAGAETEDGLEVSLDEAEIAALLGLTSLSIPYSSTYGVGRKITIDSTDESAKSGYASCGLQLSGLAAAKGVKTYTARIKIEVTGYKTACKLRTDGTGICDDGEQSPVRQSVTVTATRY